MMSTALSEWLARRDAKTMQADIDACAAPGPQPPRIYVPPLMAETEKDRKDLQNVEALLGVHVYVMPRVGGPAFRLEQWKP